MDEIQARKQIGSISASATVAMAGITSSIQLEFERQTGVE